MAPPSIAFSRLPLVMFFCSALLASARPFTFAPAATPVSLPAGRLDAVASQSQLQCWEALVEMKSCTGEIILFLLNGEAYLGPGCCSAIRVIEQSCWAADSVMSVIGFTPEEGDMLKGYCDAGDDARQKVGSVAGRKGSVHP